LCLRRVLLLYHLFTLYFDLSVMKKRGINKSLLILLCSTIFGVSALEVASRMLPKSYYSWRYRHLFISEDSVTNKAYPGGESAPWYKPNTSIMTSAYYAYSPFAKPIKEYVNWLQTNNIGLVQKANFSQDKTSIAVFGDSFTESQATTPWFYGLEKGAKALGVRTDQQLLNFGYQGTGIGRWSLILKHDREYFRIKHAVFVVIGQDFARLQTTGWSNEQLECLNTIKQCPEMYWLKVPVGIFNQEQYMVDATKNQYYIRHGVFMRFFNLVYAYSELCRLAYSIATALLLAQRDSREFLSNTERGLQIFNNVVRNSRIDTRVVFIPERHEAARRKLSDYSNNIIKKLYLQADHISICDLDTSDYYPNDGHPNDSGANKIRQCVADSIKSINQ